MERPIPHRWALHGPGISADRIMPAISRCVEEYVRTEPHHGTLACPGKHEISQTILRVVADTIWPLLAWALHHQTGVIVSMGAPQPFGSATDGNPRDSHHYEIEGSRYDGNDPVVNRRVVAFMLQALLPHWTPAQKIATALELLEGGAVAPEISPPVGRRDRGVKLSVAREWAVKCAIVRMHWRDLTLRDAQQSVGEHFGDGSGEKIRTWSRRLDHERYRESLSSANRAGQLLRQWSNADGKVGENAPPLIKMLAQTWGDEALQKQGKSFGQQERAGKARNTKTRKRRSSGQ